MKKKDADKFRYKVKITRGYAAWTLGITGFLLFFVLIPVIAIYILYKYGDSSSLQRISKIIEELK